MKKPLEVIISIEDIDGYSISEAEEKLLYLRYLVRREQEDYKLMKYQYYIEGLEKRIADLLANMPVQTESTEKTEIE